jgi:BMFP domain-containing protein YqiC
MFFFLSSKSYFRRRRTSLKMAVPSLANYEALKNHFDWLMEGGSGADVANRIAQNLQQQLNTLELVLR